MKNIFKLMSTQCFYLHMQLKFTTINSWQRGRESVIYSSKSTLFQEDSTSQAALKTAIKLSSVWKKPKFWGVLVLWSIPEDEASSSLPLPRCTRINHPFRPPISRFSHIPTAPLRSVGGFSQQDPCRGLFCESRAMGTSQTGRSSEPGGSSAE